MKIEKWILSATPYWEQENYSFPPIVAGHEVTKESLSEVVELYDGDLALIIPPKRSRYGKTNFEIFEAEVTDEFLSMMKSYIDNMTGLRITLGNGDKIEGYITNLSWTYTASGRYYRKNLRFTWLFWDVDNSGEIGD